MAKVFGHRVLVVEDDAPTAAALAEHLVARGDRPRVARSVEEALAALEEEDFCYAILDWELPFSVGGKPSPAGGEAVFRAARKKNLARVEGDDWHVFQIFALTGHRSDAKFVTRVHQLGADAFLEKPIASKESVDELLAMIATGLERARRTDHAACPQPAIAAERGGVRVAIDGVRRGRRSTVAINGVDREMQDKIFFVFLRLVAAHQRDPQSWSSKTALGIGNQGHVPTFLRAAFKGLAPDGFEVLEADGAKQLRLNPLVEIDHVDWARLCEHPDDGVKKLATEMRRRG